MLLLFFLAIAAWLIDELATTENIIAANGTEIRVADGDSFAIGAQRIRLEGIDAPEYHQTCKDETGDDWPCGKSARAALETLLRQPALKCRYTFSDRYGRLIAICRNASLPDIGAAQVQAGMAVAHEYHGIMRYWDEEGSARASRRGLWSGSFVNPAEWRKMHILKQPEHPNLSSISMR